MTEMIHPNRRQSSFDKEMVFFTIAEQIHKKITHVDYLPPPCQVEVAHFQMPGNIFNMQLGLCSFTLRQNH